MVVSRFEIGAPLGVEADEESVGGGATAEAVHEGDPLVDLGGFSGDGDFELGVVERKGEKFGWFRHGSKTWMMMMMMI